MLEQMLKQSNKVENQATLFESPKTRQRTGSANRSRTAEGDTQQTKTASCPLLGVGVHLQVLGIIFHKIVLKARLLSAEHYNSVGQSWLILFGNNHL